MHRLRPANTLLLVLLLTFAVFAPSLGNGFAMDDVPIAQSVDPAGEPDPIIRGWRAPWWYFGQRYWAGTANDSVLYRPVTVWSFALTYNLVCAPLLPVEREALPHHLLNVLLHLGAVYLVWWMLRDLGSRDRWAVTGAGLFGVHALHSEVVAGIVGRAELFAFGFGLWATLLYVRGRAVAAAALFFLAFCSKESALAWAPFLPCYVLARRWLHDRGGTAAGPPGPRTMAWTMAWTLGSGLLLFTVLRHFAIADVAGAGTFSYDQNPLAHVGAVTRWLTGIKLLGYGLWKCVAPFWLYALYGPGAVAIVTSAADAGFLAAAAVLGAWLVAGLWFARRLPLLFLSVAAFLGFSFITSNLPIVIGTVFAERLFYMPSLGVCLLPVILLPRLGRLGQRIALFLLAGWAAANIAVLVDRHGAWASSTVLFLGDADRLPASADLQAKAGYMYWVELDDPDTALVYFRRSVARDREFAATWASIARIHERRGALDRAAEFYERALRTRYIESSGVEDRTIQDYLIVLLRQKRQDVACSFAEQVLQRKPAHAFALITAVDYCGATLGAQRRQAHVAAALRAAPQLPVAILFQAMLRYESSTANDARQTAAVAEALGWSLPRVRFDLLSESTRIRARLYFCDVLAAIGRRREALAVFRELLGDALVGGDTRARIEAQVRRLER